MDQKRRPPLAKGIPIVGSFFDMRRDALGYMIRDLPKYGDVVRVRVGPMEACVVSHPEDVEIVLRGNHRNFIKNKGTRKVVAEALGQGLLTSEGETWRRQRRLTQPAFQLDQIQKYSLVMVDFTNTMLNGWHPGETRNIHSDMMRLTLEIVAQTLFTASVGDKAARVGTALDGADAILVWSSRDVPLVEVLANSGCLTISACTSRARFNRPGDCGPASRRWIGLRGPARSLLERPR